MERPDTLEEALELLNKAAQERRRELRGIIGDRYGALFNLLAGAREKASSATQGVEKMRSNIMDYAGEAVENVKDQTVKCAKMIDRHAHDKPWIFIGAVAAGAMALGVLLGTRLGDRK